MIIEWRKGIKAALPIMVGYVPIGLAFGILASQQGITVGNIFLMSLFVYAGSAQFIATAMMFSGIQAISIISTTLLVNLRHLLMSASLAPHMKGFSSFIQSLISFGITDETFAVSGNYVQNNKASAGFFGGLHIASHASWILSTVIGGIFGSKLTETAKWGLDFALSAMFIGLLIPQLKDKRGLLVCICAGLLSLVLKTYLGGNYNVIIAAIIAATIGVMTEKWNNKQSLSYLE